MGKSKLRSLIIICIVSLLTNAFFIAYALTPLRHYWLENGGTDQSATCHDYNDYITNVNFGGINYHPNGSQWYYNFNGIVPKGQVVMGETYPISVTVTGDDWSFQYVAVYIDWDQDGKIATYNPTVIDPNEETKVWQGGTGTGSRTLTGFITIPTGISPGDVYMRVMLDADSPGGVGDPSGGVGYGELQDYVLTVIANDSPPTVSLSSNTTSISENGSVATLTATLSATTTNNVMVSLGFSGTATGSGTDYNHSSSSITIPAGQLTGTASITSVDDLLDEYDETVIVDITSVTNAVENGTQQVTITMTDNDLEPTVQINDVTVTEGDSNSSTAFTVSLSAASSKTVSVYYKTQSGTATENFDYYVTMGTLTFSPGQTSKNISITVLGDTDYEAAELFYVNLTSPVNVIISDSQGIGTILNNDPPSIRVQAVSKNEGHLGNTNLDFTVKLAGASDQQITVNYATVEVTATANTDYVSTSGTLTFEPGEVEKTLSVPIIGDTVYETNEAFSLQLSNPVNATLSSTQNSATGTIVNDDSAPKVTLSCDPLSVSESGGATITATVSNLSALEVTVNLEISGSAIVNTDHSVSASTITIAAGSLSGTITLTAIDDTLDEEDETIIVDIASVTNGTEDGSQQVTLTLTDNDAPPTLSIDDPSVVEGNSGTVTLTFTVTLSAVSGKTVTVDYATANGSATAGEDYTSTNGTLTFAPGETTKNVSVSVNGDMTREISETLLLVTSNEVNASVVDAEGEGTITNDDPQPAISVNSVSIDENQGNPTQLSFTITLDRASSSIVTVDYATANDTAEAGTDYTATSGTLTFAAGEISKLVQITVHGDQTTESNETVFLNLSNANNATIQVAQGVGTIVNDDPNPLITMDDVSMNEGNSGTSAVSMQVHLNHDSAFDVTVDYATSNGTATAGIDYVATSGTLTFAPGETVKTIQITLNGDSGYENNETFYVHLSNAFGVTVDDAVGMATILNDDAAPTVTLSMDCNTIAEDGVATLTATLSATSIYDVTVQLNFEGTALRGIDYAAIGDSVIISAGNLTGTKTLTAIEDTLDEEDETIIVEIVLVSNATENGSQQVTLTLTDNDAPPTLSVDNPSVVEGNSGTATLAYTVTLSAVSGKTVTVDYATGSGTTTAGADYTSTSGTLTFAPGETTKTVSISVIGETTYENDETILCTLSNATHATVSDAEGVGTITNDDSLPSVVVNDVQQVEGSTGTSQLSFQVTLDHDSAFAITVDYTTANGTAIAGSDYVAVGGTLTFAPGETAKIVQITLNGDTGYENDETLYVNISNPFNANIGDAQGIVTILNDDFIPTVTLSLNQNTIAEDGAATATTTLSATSIQEVTIQLNFSGTAIGGIDYAPSASTITIPAGSLSGTITLTAIDDALDEEDETIIVDIASVTNGTEDGSQQVTLTLTDNDAPPTLSIDDPSVVEGNSGTVTLTFTVTLSAVSGKTVTVDYATANGSATAGEDYTSTNGTLTFAPGETTKNVSVSVNGDMTREISETLLLVTSNEVNASVVDAEGEGTITNDDPQPAISVNSVSIDENQGNPTQLSFTITLDRASSSIVTVDYATANDTAEAGTDYTATSGTLTFAAGEISKLVQITVHGDQTTESNETVFLNLSNANNATIQVAQGVGTIVNDDPNPLITMDDVSMNEGNSGTSAVSMQVHLNHDSAFDVTVDYATSNGTATAGIDYVATSGTLTFAPGETVKTIQITLNGDSGYENNETFYVHLSNAFGVTVDDAVGMATILNDDAAPTVTLSMDCNTIAEDGVATLTATLSATSIYDVTVQLNFEGTALRGIDYAAIGDSVIISAGNLTGTKTLTAIEDTLDEEDETIIVEIVLVSNATENGSQQVTLTLTDNDAPPTLSVDNPSVVEGNSGTATLAYTVTLSAVSGKTVTVDYATGSGTTTAGADYTSTSGTLTFAPGETTKTVSISVIGETTYENDETILCTLSNATHATVSDAEGVGTITNDDSRPSVSITLDVVEIAEAGEATLTLALSALTIEDVSVDLQLGGTARGGDVDYRIVSTTILIPAGQSFATTTITALEDVLDEDDETIIIDISLVQNGTEDGSQQQTLAILDNDVEPAIRISNPFIYEGDVGTKNMDFVVTLTAQSGRTVTVNYTSADGTALESMDYTAVSGTLTFLEGEIEKIIQLPILSETLEESDETVQIHLSGAVNATIGTTQGVGRILDDDTVEVIPEPDIKAIIEVNGEKQDAGELATQTEGDKTTTTLIVDDAKLNDILEEKGHNATVTLPIGAESDVAIGELNGQTIKMMEEKEAVLEIKTGSVTYTLPASQINIDEVSTQLGEQVDLKDIKVSVKISTPSDETVQIVKDVASLHNYQIIVQPVEFSITCTSGEKNVEVSKFNGYVERLIAIPEGIDPSKITTGVVLNADGTFTHVPTTIVVVEGKYYAKINSLTNSTYSIVYSPVAYSDVETHWAKEAINDMGSRLVVSGVGESKYQPERSITRAEFATILVRGLGLQTSQRVSRFEDVMAEDWFSGAVEVAAEYGLVAGYDTDTFGPYNAITREQALVMIARAMKLTDLYPNVNTSEIEELAGKFEDGEQISAFALEEVAACLKAGLANGKGNNQLLPQNFVTRAEVAVLVQRLLQLSYLI